MSKASGNKLDMQIRYIKPTLKEIKSYSEAQQTAINNGRNLTLNDYLKNNSKYSGTNTIVIADLSNMAIGEFVEPGQSDPQLLDLRGADFSNAKLDNVVFNYCRLDFASFNNSRLQNTRFERGNVLNGIDLRGTDLSTCFFDDEIQNNPPIGVKFNVTSSIAALYTELDKTELQYELELDNKIQDKENEVKEAYNKLPWFSGLRADQKSLDKYSSLQKELKQLKYLQAFKVKPEQQDVIMNRSCQNIINDSTIFDPCYDRDSSFIEKEKQKTYVSLQRKDMIDFLKLTKTNKDLSINDFAKQKFIESGQIVNDNTKYIADFSGKGSLRNGERVDLSDLVFENVNLSEANFSGVNFGGSKFIKANITKSNFEFAAFHRGITPHDGISSNESVKFIDVNAQGAIFRKIDGEDIEITNSNFRKAQLSYSEKPYAKITGSNFDYTNIEHGKWRAVDIKDCSFKNSNADQIELTGNLARCQFQQAVLSNAYMEGLKVIESDFTNAILANAQATKSKFKQTVLEKINGASINLSDAELDNLTVLDGADLHNAILSRVKAEGASLIGVNFDSVEAENANFIKANLTQAQVRFAQLEGAILNEAKAEGTDFSCSDLSRLKASGVNFQNSILRQANLSSADLTDAILQDADLRDSNLYKTLVSKVELQKVKSASGANTKQANYVENKFYFNWSKLAPKNIIQNITSVIDRIRTELKSGKNILQKKLGPSWGLVIGALAGAVVVAAATTPFTAGASWPVVVGGTVGALAGGGVLGGTLGYKFGNSLSVGSVGVVAATTAVLGAGGGHGAGLSTNLAAATAGTLVVDQALKTTTGKGVSEYLTELPVVTGIITACMVSGVGLVPAILGAGAGIGLDVAVKQVTNKSIGELFGILTGKTALEHGDKLLEVVSDKLKSYTQDKNLKEEQKQWLQEELKKVADYQKEVKKSVQQHASESEGQIREAIGNNDVIRDQVKITTPKPETSFLDRYSKIFREKGPSKRQIKSEHGNNKQQPPLSKSQ